MQPTHRLTHSPAPLVARIALCALLGLLLTHWLIAVVDWSLRGFRVVGLQ